jgi:hypothetical protein
VGPLFCADFRDRFLVSGEPPTKELVLRP